MSAHRKELPRKVRPRVRRIAAASVSAVITSVALLGAAGVIPLGGAGAAATQDLASEVAAKVGASQDATPAAKGSTSKKSTTDSSADRSTTSSSSRSTTKKSTGSKKKSSALPSSSGSGKRVVFSKSAQRVWLVDAQGSPVSTYLVSGSVTDNLEPGKYHVYSRS